MNEKLVEHRAFISKLFEIHDTDHNALRDHRETVGRDYPTRIEVESKMKTVSDEFREVTRDIVGKLDKVYDALMKHVGDHSGDRTGKYPRENQ